MTAASPRRQDARVSPKSAKPALMMSSLEQLENLLPTLSRAEKLQLLQTVLRDLGDDFPGIESRPGVCGGEPCVVRTRIPVWLL